MTQEEIQQLSMLEQSLSSTVSQKQQYNKQFLEIESALTEMKNTKEAYQIVGSIMIKKTGEELTKDLEEKKKVLEVRLASLEKQEKSLREDVKALQEKVVSELSKGEEK